MARSTQQSVSLASVGRAVEALSARLGSVQEDLAVLQSLVTALGEAAASPDEAPAPRRPRPSKATPAKEATPAPAPTRKPGASVRRAPATGGVPVTIQGPRGVDARAIYKDDGVLVLSGSVLAETMVPSMPAALKAARKELIDGKVVTRHGRTLKFARDHFFASVSTAAGVVMGRNANGWNEWRDADGQALKVLRPGA